ncbi:MAG: hypothetical protein MUF54_18030 [Polyangiaceae bacterium]|jgi:hypothetical protein|nr:hypothetical protein [Polyangiaceae bacterium]
MRRTIAGILALGTAMLVTSSAFAQDMGAEGTGALSADRLFGITGYKVSREADLPGSVEIEDTGTLFTLAWGLNLDGVDNVPVPGTIPRLSFDYFVIDDLSLGGSLGFATYRGERDGEPRDWDHDDVTAFAFAPRIGYMFHLGDSAGFWLRGGLTYFDYEVENRVDGSILQLNAEGIFAIRIVDNFAFTVGPAIDIPITGSYEHQPGPGPYDVDTSVLSFGAYCGLMGWF